MVTPRERQLSGSVGPRMGAPWRQGMTDIKLGFSAGQIAAREFGKETPLPSLELALEKPTAIAF
ncbi:MAG: hypothetical protein CM1200mP25_1960 [Acidobacteriota bacterium]|nr:MAG: hypothetical protein CM1200mP25_1960 [Acidobacteriota bacterium]